MKTLLLIVLLNGSSPVVSGVEFDTAAECKQAQAQLYSSKTLQRNNGNVGVGSASMEAYCLTNGKLVPNVNYHKS